MQLFKDIVLILTFLLVILMFATVFVSFFMAKVPFVPTRKKILPLLEPHLKDRKGQLMVDIGCGDGKVLFWAEKKLGLKGRGFEIAPLPYLLSQISKYIRSSSVELRFANFFKQNLQDANLIFCYLFPELVEKAYDQAKKQCKPGTLFICNTFRPKQLEPVKIISDETNKPYFYIYQL